MKPEHFFCSSIMFTKNLIIFVFLSLTAAHALAAPAPVQKQKKDSTARRVLSYSQFVKEMVECTAAVYRLENVVLRFNNGTADTAFTTYREFPDGSALIRSVPEKTNSVLPTYSVKSIVILRNIDIEKRSGNSPNLTFDNFSFESGLSISESRCNLDFHDCMFSDLQQDKGFSGFNASRLTATYLGFFRCTFKQELAVVGCQLDDLGFYECKQVNSLDCQIRENQIKNFDFKNTTFDKVQIDANTFGVASVAKCFFDKLIFDNTIQRQLEIYSCSCKSGVFFYGAQFPHKNTAIPFKQFAKKMALNTVDSSTYRTIIYRAINDVELTDEDNYNALISIYTDFLSLYKTRGDQESYNACYVEMKQIHTRRAGYMYRKTPALETWFDWRLNQLLEVFSDYGTNSAKGLIYIFYVIIGFAALYLVFPSEADNLSREKSFRMFDVVIGYFSTNATLVNISEHKRRRALDDLHNFRTTLEVSRKDVPAFIAWLGAPLYGLNKAYLGFSAWLVERFDIIPGRWNELSAGRKAWTGTAVGAYMLGFLVWGVVMRFVNAFALSINAFVTLGYGEIQARGMARYLAVLEGAVGWFLLSIFSVTLISQLLQ